MYDVIIIGARCAGAATGRILAEKGYRVLMVDAASFPSDTISTHVVKIPGLAMLKRWQLLDRVTALNCPPIAKMSLDCGPFVLTGSAPPLDGIDADYSPRRYLLDKILVDAAVEAGVELRAGFTVDEIISEEHRVCGIAGRGRNGNRVVERAHIVIGADGARSLLARTVDAPCYHHTPPLTCSYYTYWSGINIDGAELYMREHRAIIAMPTNDNLVCILIQWPHEEYRQFRADIEKGYLDTLALAPGLAARVSAGNRAERYYGSVDLPNFVRKPYGEGWTLVGDAGCHKDPITAQGITDAFRDAQLLADAIDTGFSGAQPLSLALAEYERKRNEAVLPIYQLTCQLARLESTPQMQQLLGSLRGNQAEIDRFIGVIVGTVPVTEFFPPKI